MLQTVEAEVDVNGEIRLLEPLHVNKKSRAIVTLLENGNAAPPKIVNKISELLQNPDFAKRQSYPAEQIEAQIEDARNSWE